MKTAQTERRPIERQFLRYVLSVHIHVTRKAAGLSHPIPGLSMEISEGGFSAMLTEELKVGEEVEVSFNLSGTGRVKADAIVKDKNLFRYGFEFVDLNEEVRSQVRETCASLLLYTGGCH